MKINVGLCKKGRKKRVYKNVQNVEVPGVWGAVTHETIKQAIKKQFPDWDITGYAWVED